MSLLKTVFTTFNEALFPIPAAEREALAMGPLMAFRNLSRSKPSPIPEACSVFSYKDERVWRLIWSIKYKKSCGGTAIAGHALHRVLRSYVTAISSAQVEPTVKETTRIRMATQIIVVPMPITARRRRERGFNQCELLANEIERLANDWIAHNSHDVIGKQVGDLNTVDESVIRRCRENRLIVVRDLLVRKLHKSRQTLKDREERLESAHDIFAVNENVANRIMSGHSSSVKIGVQPKTSELQSTNADQQPINKPFIIVIDDVITTGGTIRDAISTLKKAGFENTWGLSVAH